MAAGNNHLVILTTQGHLYTLGAGEQYQLGRKIIEGRKIDGTNPRKIVLGKRSRRAVYVAAGSYHSFAIDENDEVWGWGLNNFGQTGTGWFSEIDNIVYSPQKIESLSKQELAGDYVTEIAGGEHHSLFLTSAGKVYSCGRMNGGQLGLEDDNPVVVEWRMKYAKKYGDKLPQLLPTPAQITFPDANDPVAHVSAGLHNNAVVT